MVLLQAPEGAEEKGRGSTAEEDGSAGQPLMLHNTLRYTHAHVHTRTRTQPHTQTYTNAQTWQNTQGPNRELKY